VASSDEPFLPSIVTALLQRQEIEMNGVSSFVSWVYKEFAENSFTAIRQFSKIE
jgi:hypothetical protein